MDHSLSLMSKPFCFIRYMYTFPFVFRVLVNIIIYSTRTWDASSLLIFVYLSYMVIPVVNFQPPPAPRARSKMDSLLFMPDSIKSAKVEETVTPIADPLPMIKLDDEDTNKEESKVEAENVERPVDLYKVLSSSSSQLLDG